MPLSNKPNPKNNPTSAFTVTCNTIVSIPFAPEPFVIEVLKTLTVPRAFLEVTFVDNAHIHEMNRHHLDHDWPTDIITFDLSSETDETLTIEGDLYISVEQAEIQAKELGHTTEKELKILIIHGILHLLGYDDHTPEDQSEMDEMQLRIYDLLHS